MKETITYLEDNSWRDEIHDFASAIVNGEKIKYGNSNDALETMKLVYRIYYADSTWREIYKISDPDRSREMIGEESYE